MHIHGSELQYSIRNMKKNAICWLHHWFIVSDRNFCSNLMHYYFCRVTLCGSCFVTFHTVNLLNNIKRRLAIELHYN